MKIGILLTDDLREALQGQFFNYAGMFKTLLAPGDFEFIVYDVRSGEYPQAVNDCDGYLITGSRHGVYEDLPWLPPFFEFIRTLHAHKTRLIGVCFGHQAVAVALGGSVKKSDKGWGIGAHAWEVCEVAPWMTPVNKILKLLCVHQDQVETLPPQAVHLARSEFCENAAFSIGQHIFCVQGHPEFDADYLRALLPYLREVAPADVVDAAQASADNPVDSAGCAQWFINFYRQ